MDHIFLQLFAEGGGDGAASANAGGNGAPEASSTVVYGKQDGEASQPVEQQPTETPEETFDSLINGKYKEDFAKKTQQIINARFRQTKQLEEQRDALRPVLDALSAKYGVDAKGKNFVAELQAAIDADDTYYEAEADRMGLTVAQLKDQRRMEAENAQLREAIAERERQEARDNVYSGWLAEGEQLKTVYPSFDLEVEAQNESFVHLLQNGINVKTAYEVIHKDELLSGAIGYAVKTAQQRTVDNIRARGMRPQEAGAGSTAQAAQIVKANPADWSKQDMAEVLRRVRSGEKIRL